MKGLNLTHPSHEDDAVNAHLPLLLEHLAEIHPEFTSCRLLAAGCASLAELFGLREEDTDDADPDRDTSYSEFISSALYMNTHTHNGH